MSQSLKSDSDLGSVWEGQSASQESGEQGSTVGLGGVVEIS